MCVNFFNLLTSLLKICKYYLYFTDKKNEARVDKCSFECHTCLVNGQALLETIERCQQNDDVVLC